jgi:rod shape determining protein RodA
MSRRDTFAGRNIDWMTLVLTLALMLIGWLMIYAVSYDGQHPENNSMFSGIVGKQAFFIGASVFIIFITYIIERKFWQTFSYPIYVFGILLLLGLFFLGAEIKGAISWYRIGSFTFQPSEIAKFTTSIALAAYLSRFNTDIRNLKTQVTAFGLFVVPAGLILLQGDAGSAMVFSAFLVVLFRQGLSANFYIVSGVSLTLLLLGLVFSPLSIILGLILLSVLILIFNIKTKLYWLISFLILLSITLFASSRGYFLRVFIINLVLFIIFAGYTWLDKKRALISRLIIFLTLGAILVFSSNFAFNNILQPHQQARINAWLQPSKTAPLYNVIQSKLAIGSGGFYGKGYLNGTMTLLDYVPEQSTDFIFCTIGEEQGFVGSVGIIGIIFLLIYRIVVLAERQRSEFSRNYAYAIAGILFVHCFVNIGMTMGLVPVVGIPLPFISYGGSSILSFSLMIGVLLKLDSQRYTT